MGSTRKRKRRGSPGKGIVVNVQTIAAPPAEAFPCSIGEVIGHGLIGSLRRATYLETGFVVALEEIPGSLRENAVFVMRLGRAGQIASALRHESIVAIYDLVDDGSRLYVMEELATGTSLESVLKTGVMPSVAAALAIVDGVAVALEAAHQEGVAHGQIGPTAVLLTPDGGVRVIGFGISGALSTDDAGSGGPQPADDLRALAGLGMGLLGDYAEADAVERALSRQLDPEADRRFATATELRAAVEEVATEAFGPGWCDQSAIVALLSPSAAPETEPTAARIDAGTPQVESPPRPRRRPVRQGLLMAAITAGPVVAGIVISLAVLALVKGTAPGPLAVQPGVSLTVTPVHGGCNANFVFVAKGAVHGQGTLSYRWELSDGWTTAVLQQPIGGSQGTFEFSESRQYLGIQNTTTTVTFRILAPSTITVTRTFVDSC